MINSFLKIYIFLGLITVLPVRIGYGNLYLSPMERINIAAIEANSLLVVTQNFSVSDLPDVLIVDHKDKDNISFVFTKQSGRLIIVAVNRSTNKSTKLINVSYRKAELSHDEIVGSVSRHVRKRNKALFQSLDNHFLPGGFGQESPNRLKENEIDSWESFIKRKYDLKIDSEESALDSFKELLSVRSKDRDFEWISKMEDVRIALYKKYVIKDSDIPENYIQLQHSRQIRDGTDQEITADFRSQLIKKVVGDQKATLDVWIDFLIDSDADIYTNWARYWAFREMVKLSRFDKEREKFIERRADTVNPFPDLSRDALVEVFRVVGENLQGRSTASNADKDLDRVIKSDSFSKLYAYFFSKITLLEEDDLKNTEGKWVKYPRGSDHLAIVKSTRGFGTEWCTCAPVTAEEYLEKGDFYIYFSNDENGKPRIPRAAIAMEGDQIIEVRGVSISQQELDPYIIPVVEKKLAEFPDWEKFQKKTSDIRSLTNIISKIERSLDLNRQDLRFLYEIDGLIRGFGNRRDPRIEKIKKIRESRLKADYALIYDVQENEVALELSEIELGKTKIVITKGLLSLSENTSLEDINKYSKIVGLNANLTDVDPDIKNQIASWQGSIADRSQSFEYENLENVGGSFSIVNSKKVRAPKLKNVGFVLSTVYATSFDAPNLENVGRSVEFRQVKNVNIPSLRSVGVSFTANVLDSFIAESLESVGEDINIDGALKVSISSLKNIGGSFAAKKLTTFVAQNLVSIGKNLDIENAIEATIPKLKRVGESIFAQKLKSLIAQSLENVGKDLIVERASKVIVPGLERVGGYANFMNGKKVYAPSFIMVGNGLSFKRSNYVNIPRGRFQFKFDLAGRVVAGINSISSLINLTKVSS